MRPSWMTLRRAWLRLHRTRRAQGRRAWPTACRGRASPRVNVASRARRSPGSAAGPRRSSAARRASHLASRAIQMRRPIRMRACPARRQAMSAVPRAWRTLRRSASIASKHRSLPTPRFIHPSHPSVVPCPSVMRCRRATSRKSPRDPLAPRQGNVCAPTPSGCAPVAARRTPRIRMEPHGSPARATTRAGFIRQRSSMARTSHGSSRTSIAPASRKKPTAWHRAARIQAASPTVACST